MLVNDCSHLYCNRLINTARNRLRDIFRHDDYKHFDVTKDDGKVLAKSLTDLMKQGDDNLTLSSALLLFDIYQVSCSLSFSLFFFLSLHLTATITLSLLF